MALWSLGTNNLFISESIHPKNQWTRSSVHCQCQGFIRKSEIRFIYKLQCQDKIYGSSFDSYLNSPKIITKDGRGQMSYFILSEANLCFQKDRQALPIEYWLIQRHILSSSIFALPGSFILFKTSLHWNVWN